MKRAGDNDGAMLDESDSDERNGVSGEESHDSTDERMVRILSSPWLGGVSL